MALHFSLEQMTRLREGARHLAEDFADHETRLNALLAGAEHDSATTQRGLREMCVQARQQHVALDRLVTDLGDRRPPAVPDQLRPHAVLVVDGHEETREWLTELLQNPGFVVRTAANGLEAVLVANQLQPAVIVTDITMPVLDGVEAARLIKTIDVLRDARVIAYTAQRADQHPQAAGLFAAILPKPSPPDQILAAVQRWAPPA